MKKSDIVRAISKKTNFTIDNTEIAVNALIEVFQEAMVAGEDKIILKGIGTFKKKVRASYEGRNPSTGEPVKVPEKTLYNFKISKQLQDEING